MFARPLFLKTKLEKPEKIPRTLKIYYDEPLSGHCGIVETTRKIRKEFFWKEMNITLKTTHGPASSVNVIKFRKKYFQDPMVPSTESFERVSINLVSCSDISDNHKKYISTLQDELMRYVQAYPIPDKETVTKAKQLLHFCQHNGVSKRFHSDQGTEFMNNIMT